MVMGCQAQPAPTIPVARSNSSALVVDACGLPGADVGAKINNADAALGSSYGDITVYNCSGAISTQVILNSGHTLRLGAGDYPTTLDEEIILLKDNTSVIGSGWQTVIHESSHSPTNNGLIIFRAYDDSHDGTTPNSNLTIKDLQIASGSGVVAEGTRSAIILGNVQNALVDNVYFNATHAIGVEVGGYSGTAEHYHSRGATIRGCVFDTVFAVSTALVNARDAVVDNNRYLGSQVNSDSTYIDVEVNTETDLITNFRITNNTLDPTGGAGQRYGIVVYGANANPGPGVIANNVLLGGLGDGSCQTTEAIQIGAEDTILSGNFIKYFCNAGIHVLSTAQHNTVSNNTIKYVGNYSILVEGSHNRIIGNIDDGSETSPDQQGFDVQIEEANSADYNYYAGNQLTTYYNPPGGGAYFQARINLVGAHSVAHDNLLDGVNTSTRAAQVVMPTAVSADYTVSASDQIILADASAGNLTVTLPTAVSTTGHSPPTPGGGLGRILIIKSVSGRGGAVMIAPTATQTIDGSPALTLSLRQAVTLISDGANWQILART
jgi:hypothetical protein